MADLLMFHGQECPFCRKMMPLVERLERETSIRFDRREVWHDEANAELMRSYAEAITSKCGKQLRVPTFVNPETRDVLCGSVEYEKLRDWAVKPS